MSETATKWQIYTAANPTVTRIIPELAVEIGLNESIVLMQICHWIHSSNNVRDGAYWTYQSLRKMHKEAFPYWSLETLRRTIKSLVDAGYIIVGNYNKRKGDTTQWFALEPDKLSSLKSILVAPDIKFEGVSKRDGVSQNVTGVSQNVTGVSQNVTTLPEITPEIKQIPATDVAVVVVLDGLNDFLKALAAYADSKRDPVFEAVSTHLLEIDHTALGKNDAVRGRVNGLAKVARDTFQGVYPNHFAEGWTRELKDKCAAAINQFVKDWRSQKNIVLPTGRDKFGTEFMKFLQAAAKPKRPVITTAPPTPQYTQAELDAARDLARSIPRREVNS